MLLWRNQLNAETWISSDFIKINEKKWFLQNYLQINHIFHIIYSKIVEAS